MDGEKMRKNTLRSIPKTVDEIFKRDRAFIRGEVVAGSAEVARASQWDKGNIRTGWSGGQERIRERNGPRELKRSMGTCAPYLRREAFTPLTKTPREILAMKSVNFPPPTPLIGTPKKKNLKKFYDYHRDRGHNTNACYHLKKQIEEVMATGMLAHVVKDIRMGNQRIIGQGHGNVKRSFKEHGCIRMDTSGEHSCASIHYGTLVLEQRGKNMEVYLEEAVVKSKSEEDLIEDVKETLYKLQRVNIKLDPSGCTFEMEEVKFLGCVATTKGINTDPEKLAELIFPLRNILKSIGTKEASNWTSEAEKALQVNVVIDGPMGEILKSSGTFGPLALWAVELKTYHILYVQREEVEGKIMKKFFGHGEQVMQAPNKNDEGTSREKEKIQEELILTLRAWMIYIRRESNKEGPGVALLAGLSAPAGRRMKDLHVFVSSKLLVDQVEGNRVPRTKGAKRYREEVMDAMAPFHRFRITHLPKVLNPKAEALTGFASILLEFLNQEVSVGIKTRPLVKASDKLPEETKKMSKKATSGKASPA
ncbi:reverse transcriptase domain-containing protein [Tanacetum coccineum]